MELSPKNSPKISISAQQFERVFSINVTLDLINPVSTTLWKLGEAGFASGIEKCWSISLNDLRVIVEILDQPALFLHYLVRRLDINVLQSVESRDELDYLMHYVKHGLFFREANLPAANEHLMLGGFTDELDQYYRKLQGISDNGEKPCVRLGELTQRLLSNLQRSTPPHWASGCVELLEFDTPMREELLGKQAEHLKRLQDPRGAYALSFVANFENQAGIALASSTDLDRARAVIIARCKEHCIQHSISVLWCFLVRGSLSNSIVEIMRVSRDTEVSEHTLRLLDQLKYEIQITEKKTTGSQA